MSKSHHIAVQRTLLLFERMAERPGGLSFGQIEHELSVSAASLNRLLKTLRADGWLEWSTERLYVPGQRLHKVMRGMSGRWTVGEMVAPYIRKLAMATGQSACFASYANYSFTLLEKHEMASSYHFIALNVVNDDMIENGIGRTILAHLDAKQRTEIIRRKVPEGDRDALVKNLDEISRNSVYLSKENSVTRLMAPLISDADGALIGVVSLAMLGRHPAKDTKQYTSEILSTVENIRERLREPLARAI